MGPANGPASHNMGPFWVWGYDEISWFAKQTPEYRRNWLRYAYDWLAKTDPQRSPRNARQQANTPELTDKKWYDANNKSEAVPNGHGDEDTIRDIWSKGRNVNLNDHLRIPGPGITMYLIKQYPGHPRIRLQNKYYR